jgi:hypothetical protein
VRVVFPLPNGNAIVVMRPEANLDGSLSLVSAGDGFGAPGFYFTFIQTGGGEVRADHVLTLWGATFLQLHYRLRRPQATTSPAA